MRDVLNRLSGLLFAVSLAVLITAVAAGASGVKQLSPDCGPADQDRTGDWYCVHPEYCPPSESCLLNVINNGGDVTRNCDCTSSA
jgi:hypothetical protein